MNVKETLNKVFNPNNKAKKELRKFVLKYGKSNNSFTYKTKSDYGDVISGTVCPWEDAYGNPIQPLLDIDDDSKQTIYINKDNKKYEMTREELYRLKFMLDEEGETIDSAPLEMFLNYLTAVKI